jgi:hypothetical protein
MSQSFLEEFVESSSGMRRYQQERAISEAVGLICEVMDEQNISRSDLANMLGKTKGWVTQLLDGETNKTIRTIADVLAVLGREYHSSERPIQIGSKAKTPRSRGMKLLADSVTETSITIRMRSGCETTIETESSSPNPTDVPLMRAAR